MWGELGRALERAGVAPVAFPFLEHAAPQLRVSRSHFEYVSVVPVMSRLPLHITKFVG